MTVPQGWNWWVRLWSRLGMWTVVAVCEDQVLEGTHLSIVAADSADMGMVSSLEETWSTSLVNYLMFTDRLPCRGTVKQRSEHRRTHHIAGTCKNDRISTWFCCFRHKLSFMNLASLTSSYLTSINQYFRYEAYRQNINTIIYRVQQYPVAVSLSGQLMSVVSTRVCWL